MCFMGGVLKGYTQIGQVLVANNALWGLKLDYEKFLILNSP